MSFSDIVYSKYRIQDKAFETFKSNFLDVLYRDSRDFSNEQYEKFELLIENFHEFISADDKGNLDLDSIKAVNQLNKDFAAAFKNIFKEYFSNIQSRKVAILNFSQCLINLAKSIVQQNRDDYTSVFNEFDGAFSNLRLQLLDLYMHTLHNYTFEAFKNQFLETYPSDSTYFTQQNTVFENFVRNFFKILAKNDNLKQFPIDTYNAFESLIENFLLFISFNDKKDSFQDAMNTAVANLNETYCDSFKDICTSYLSNDVNKKKSRKTTILDFCKHLHNLTLRIINPDLNVCQTIRNDLDFILFEFENELIYIDLPPQIKDDDTARNN